MFPGEWLIHAEKLIAPYIQKTPLTHDKKNGVIIKWENHQIGGSFKIRGALNKVLSLRAWELEQGLVAASAGNHGIGVAWAANLVNAPATIFVPQTVASKKMEIIQNLGAQIQLVNGGYREAEKSGLEFARRTKATWISPYNDGQVIAGQGTLGLEIINQSENLKDADWIVPVGGGGLISGIGSAIELVGKKQKTGKLRIIGVQSEASPYFYHLFHNKSQEDIPEFPSLADGLSGPVEEDSITIPLVDRIVDDMILVSELAIAQAIAYVYHEYNEIIEGSAATTVAALLNGIITDRPVVLIITGGNIDRQKHQEILQNYPRPKQHWHL